MSLPAFLALPAPTGRPVDEAVRAAAVLVVLGLVFAVAEAWRHRASPPTEWTRKFIHSMVGLVTLTFPWVFARTETLVVLGAAVSVILLLARRAGRLRSLFDVERGSWGELYFPLAVLLLFALGRERPLFYVLSIAALVVCDALAAVLGREYGRHSFRVTTDRKSLEGSAVFLLSAFLLFHLPLLLASDIDRLGAVLIAAQLALLVTSFEAISGRGSDNLIVPVATYYLLVKLTGNTTTGIALQLAAQLAILALALLIAWRTRFLSLSGAVASHLVLYAAFSLGGPAWIVAPLLALLAFLWLDALHRRATRSTSRLPRHVTVIFYVAIVATACLFADNTFLALGHVAPRLAIGSPFFAPFVGALGAPLAIAGTWTTDVLPAARGWPPLVRGLVSGVLAWGVVAPAGIAAVRGRLVPEEAAIVALVIAASLALYAAGSRAFRPERWGRSDLRLLAAAVLFAVLLALPLHLALTRPLGAGMIFRREPVDRSGGLGLEALIDGQVRARATLYEARDLVGAPGPSGLIGAYEAADTEAGRLVLEEACRDFAARGMERVLGPMNGGTWHAYRVVLPPVEQPPPPGGIAWPPFPGEPVNPPDTADAWRAAGFSIVARYESAVVFDLKAAGGARPGPPAGVRLRRLALARYDEELALLFAASLRGFARNPYFAPIDRAEFDGLYLPLKPLVDPTFVEIAEDDAGQVLGFLLCYAWPGATALDRPVLIAKTIAVVPEARGRGLGRILFARAHGRAFVRGFGAVIHALMHVANVSTRLSAGEQAQPFRRYALFGRTP